MSWEILKSEYGNIASVIGTIFTLIGFTLTLWQIRKARNAAEQAQKMAQEALDQVSARLFVGHVANGVRLATELANACRTKQWERAIDRCEQLLFLLTTLVEDRNLTREERDYAVIAIDDLPLILRQLDEILHGKRSPPLSDRARTTLSVLTVYLGRLDGRLKNIVLEIHHGK